MNMTIKIDRRPTALHLLVVLDKNKGVKDTGMIDPKSLGKTDATGTVVAVGQGVNGFYIGDKVYLPVNQQKDTFVYEGNTFCTVHYSYITLFMTDEYEVNTEKSITTKVGGLGMEELQRVQKLQRNC